MEESKKNSGLPEVPVYEPISFKFGIYYKDVPMPLKTLSVDEANSISQTPQAEVCYSASGRRT